MTGRTSYDLVIDAWELECCGPALVRGTLLELTLTAKRWPALARLLDWPEVPGVDAVFWPELPTSGRDHSDFILYGSLHGPDQGPRVRLEVEEIREIRGELEHDPGGRWEAVRLREDSLRVVWQDSLPERLGLTASALGPEPTVPPTVAVALRVHPR